MSEAPRESNEKESKILNKDLIREILMNISNNTDISRKLEMGFIPMKKEEIRIVITTLRSEKFLDELKKYNVSSQIGQKFVNRFTSSLELILKWNSSSLIHFSDYGIHLLEALDELNNNLKKSELDESIVDAQEEVKGNVKNIAA